MSADVAFVFPRTFWISLRHLEQRLSDGNMFLPLLNILVEGEVEQDPLEGGRRRLSAGHKEILDAGHKVQDTQVVPLVQFTEVNVDEVRRVLRIMKSSPPLHLQ